MVNPCTIRDLLPLAYMCLDRMSEDQAILWVRTKLYDMFDKFFIFDPTAALYYESFGRNKYCIHLVGSTKDIKGYKNFVKDTGYWIFEHTNCTSLIALSSVSNKRLQRFISLTGATRSGTILGSGENMENEIVYSYPKSRYLEEGINYGI